MADISEWDPADEANTDAPPHGWPEFMQPSAVNNCARAMMGAVRRWYDTVTAQLAGLTTTVNNKVSRSGDTMTGDLTIVTAGYSSLSLTKSGAGGFASQIVGGANAAGGTRWIMQLGASDTETGGNAGSSFQLHRYADNGAYLGSPMSISRATGSASFTQALTLDTGGSAAGHATRKDYVDQRDSDWYGAATTWANTQDITHYNNATSYAAALDTAQRTYIDNRDNAVLAAVTERVWKGGDVMTGALGVPYVYGGASTAGGGSLRTHGNTNNVCFRWDNTNLEYRIDEVVGKMICDSRNWFNVGVEVGGGGPTNWVLGGLGGATWFYCHVDITASDERIKSNITDSEIDALGLLGRVKLSQFDIKPEVVAWCRSVDKTPDERAQMMREAQPAHVDIGFVAQQVKEVIPEAVFCADQHGVAPDGPLPDDLQSINNQMFIPYLVRAVQQLQARVEMLEGRT